MTKADERAVLEGCRYNHARGQIVVDFFAELLRHSKGPWAGKPFVLEPWQRENIILPLFGWERPYEDHPGEWVRRFRLAYITMAKKNGKSTLSAGIALYLLVADGEAGAEVYSAAADRRQASLVFDEAVNMVFKSPILQKRLTPTRSQKTISNADLSVDDSRYVAISADAYRQEGLQLSGLIFDELHAQPDRRLWDTLRYGGRARSQPLLVAITTAGWDKQSICYEQYRQAKSILDGSWDSISFFPYVAEAEPDDDWTDEAVWRKANPNLGVSVDLSQFREEFEEAREAPIKENTWRRYSLNQWVAQETRFLPMDKWHKCERDFDEASLEGQRCWAGVDMASRQDLTGLVLVFPQDDGDYKVLPYCWAPRDGAEVRARRDGAPYLDWEKNDHICLTEGNTTSFSAVWSKLCELGRRFDIEEVCIDPYNVGDLCNQLQDEGFTVVEIQQNAASLNDAVKECLAAVLTGRMHHNGHPALTWCAGNMTVKLDTRGDLRPDKSKAGEKIDVMVALICALKRAMVDPGASGLFAEGMQWA